MNTGSDDNLAGEGELDRTRSLVMGRGNNVTEGRRKDCGNGATVSEVRSHRWRAWVIPKRVEIIVPGCRERPATVRGTSMRLGAGRPLSRAAANAMAKAEASNAAMGGENYGRLQPEVAKASPLMEYLRRRRSACVGLRQALELEQEACANAKEEFVLALADFESDHSLEITW